MAVLKKSSLVDQVYDRLRTEIITLRRPLGSKVNVSELQTTLGVSCTPIREALNRLQQEGLVVFSPNVGAHVLTLTGHDIMEIQQLAVTLHCAAVRLALEEGDRPAILAELERHLEEYRTAKTPQSEVLAVNQFLGTFYRSCGNRRLDNSMIAIQGQQLLLRHIYVGQMTARSANAADFEDMLAGARQGDAERVCAAIRANADRATPVLLAFAERDNPTKA